VCRDPHDDYLVALAVATGAESIVTGDRDLLELPEPPVAVLTPRALIERLDAPYEREQYRDSTTCNRGRLVQWPMLTGESAWRS
jgi:hypothetical protein